MISLTKRIATLAVLAAAASVFALPAAPASACLVACPPIEPICIFDSTIWVCVP